MTTRRVEPGAVLLVIPPCGFPGGAFLAVVERLRDAGRPSVIVSARAGERCVGDGDVRVTADPGWDDPALDVGGALVLFDDKVGTVAREAAVGRRIAGARAAGRPVGAIGTGILALAEAGVLRRRAVATPRGMGGLLARSGAEPLEGAPLVIADGVMTATEEGAGPLGDEIGGLKGVPTGAPSRTS